MYLTVPNVQKNTLLTWWFFRTCLKNMIIMLDSISPSSRGWNFKRCLLPRPSTWILWHPVWGILAEGIMGTSTLLFLTLGFDKKFKTTQFTSRKINNRTWKNDGLAILMFIFLSGGPRVFQVPAVHLPRGVWGWFSYVQLTSSMERFNIVVLEEAVGEALKLCIARAIEASLVSTRFWLGGFWVVPSLKLTAIAPENGWLEDNRYDFPVGAKA